MNIFDRMHGKQVQEEPPVERKPLTNIFDLMHGHREERARANLLTQDVSPEAATSQLRLSRETGLPVPFVRDNEARIRHRQQVESIDYEGLRRDAPRVLDALNDPAMAPAVSDSASQIADWHRTFKEGFENPDPEATSKFIKNVVTDRAGYTGAGWIATLGGLKRSYGEWGLRMQAATNEQLRVDLREEFDRIFEGVPPHAREQVASSSLHRRQVFDQMRRLEQMPAKAQAWIDEGTLQAEIASGLREFYAPGPDVPPMQKFLGEAVGATLDSVLPLMGLGVAGGAVFGLAGRAIGGAAGLTTMYGRVYGDKYQEMRREGYTAEQADLHSHAYALMETIPELLPLKIALTPRGVDIEDFVRKIAETGLAEAAQESFTELLQIGYEWGVLDHDIDLGEAIGRVFHAAALGGTLGVNMGAIGAGADWRNDVISRKTLEEMATRRRAYEEERRFAGNAGEALTNRLRHAAEQDTLSRMVENARNTPLLARDRELWQEVADVEGNVYVSADTLREFFQARDPNQQELFEELEVDPEKAPAAKPRAKPRRPAPSGAEQLQMFLDSIPGAAEQMAEAEQTGGDLVLPLAPTVATLATTEGLEELQPSMRLTPESTTLAEYEDVVAELEQDAADTEQRAAIRDKVSEFEKRVTSEVRATGMAGKASRLYAQAFGAYYETMSLRLRNSPEATAKLDEWANGLTFRSDAAANVQPGSMEQQRQLEGERLPASLEWMRTTSRYDVAKLEPRGTTQRYQVLPERTGMETVAAREFDGEAQGDLFYDPELASVEEDRTVVDLDGTEHVSVTRVAHLKEDSGYSESVPAEQQDGVLYRGMSAEEYEALVSTGELRSRGEYNLGGEQEGTTSYTTEPDSAAFYATGFAPAQFKPSRSKPAYVVAVRDPGTARDIEALRGTHERSIPGTLHAEDVLAAYRGDVYAARPGDQEVVDDVAGFRAGSSSAPSVRVAWREIEFTPNILNQTKLSPEEIDGQQPDGSHPGLISERLPRAKRVPKGVTMEDPMEELLSINLAVIAQQPDVLSKMTARLRKYVGFTTNRRNPDRVAEDFIEHVVDNLVWLFNKVTPEVRERSRKWYDGARAITTRWAEKYQIPDIGVAGALAALSPQKDWFENVSAAERILDIHTRFTREDIDYVPTKKHLDTAVRLNVKPPAKPVRKKRKPMSNEKWASVMAQWEQDVAVFERDKPELQRALRQLLSTRYVDLTDNIDRAMWVRAWDQTFNDRRYRVITPEGDFLDEYAGDHMRWGSNAEIGKAIGILMNPTRAYISASIGDAHKVRSFFNNIVAPHAPLGSVTMDTHAVGAGLLRVVSDHSPEVTVNFSGFSSLLYGNQGAYGVLGEAYRRAAAQLNEQGEEGLLPREVQSITWEAVRGLFERNQKKRLREIVDGYWRDVEKGKLTLTEARDAIFEAAGRITPPAWVGKGPSAGDVESARPTSYTGQLDVGDVPGRVAGRRAGRAAGGTSYGQSATLPGRVTLTHWSQREGLQSLDPEKHGTGHTDAASRRKRNDPDNWVPRTYFGMDVGKPGGYVMERGLGPYEYTVTLDGSTLYDFVEDPQQFRHRAQNEAERTGGDVTNVRERLIKDAGFAGYWVDNPSLGRVAALFEATTPDAVQEEAPAPAPEPAARGDVVFGTEMKGTGLGFREFFTKVTRGIGGKSDTGAHWEPVIPTVAAALGTEGSDIAVFSEEYAKHRGNFDDHIAFSIPGYRETQVAVGTALLQVYGTDGGTMLDVGASEGSLVKTLAALSDGRIMATGLDPNVAMAEHFNTHSTVPGADYAVEAFSSAEDAGKELWTEDDGTVIRGFRPPRKYDVIHESMVFQFVSNTRAAQVARMKEMLTPNGIVLLQEKVGTRRWDENEAQKDAYKGKFFTAAQMEQKRKEVLERKGDAVEGMNDAVEGMNDLMVSDEELRVALASQFRYVYQYWDSGNFKGYVASDSLVRLTAFADALVPLDSEFDTRPATTPPVGLEDFVAGRVGRILDKDGWAILTAENLGNQAMPAEDNAKLTEQLRGELDAMGVEYHEVLGRYGGPVEHSLLVLTDLQTARDIGRRYGQEAILTKHGLVYGDGSVNPATGVTVHSSDPGDFYSTIPDAGGVTFTVDVDFDTKTELSGPSREELRPTVHQTTEGPLYEGRDVSLFPTGSMMADWQAYRVIDNETGSQVGSLIVTVKDGAVTHLNVLQVNSDQRGQGVGRKVVETILAGADSVVEIVDISPSASGFWMKVGAYGHSEDGKHARFDWGSYVAASRRGTAADAGAEAAATAGAAGAAATDPAEVAGQGDVAAQGAAREAALRQVVEVVPVENAFAMKMLFAASKGDPMHLPLVPGPESLVPGEWMATPEDGVLRLTEDGTLEVMTDVIGSLLHSRTKGGVTEVRLFGTLNPNFERMRAEVDRVQGALYQSEVPGFYSQMQRALGERLPGRGSPAEMKQAIQAAARKGLFKAEELQWSGVEAWLDMLDADKVTKQQVMEYLAKNELKVTEELRGGSNAEVLTEDDVERKWRDEVEQRVNYGWSFEEVTDESAEELGLDLDAGEVAFGDYVAVDDGGYIWREGGGVLRAFSSEVGAREAVLDSLEQDGYEKDEFVQLLHDMGYVLEDEGEAVKYEEYQAVSGGDSYFELTFQLPKLGYSSSHWEESGVVAHARASELRDTEGNRVLVVQEVQSDLHQGAYELRMKEAKLIAKDKGISVKEAAKEVPADFGYVDGSPVTWDDVLRARDAANDNSDRYQLAFGEYGREKARVLEPVEDSELLTGAEVDALVQQDEKAAAALQRLQDAQAAERALWDAADEVERQHNLQSGKMPDAPFRTTWPLLAMKRMLRWAAENGYDKLAWTTGEQQAELYRLDKYVDSLTYSEGTQGGHLVAYDAQGAAVLDKEDISGPEELSDIIGAEVAEKLLSQPADLGGHRELRGADLRVGGEGKRTFYDKALVSEMKRYLKKWGVRVGETQIYGVQAWLSGETHPEWFAARRRLQAAQRLAEPDVEAIERLQAEVDRLEREARAAQSTVHSVDITPIMRESVMEGQPLFQGTRRGSIRFADNKTIITVFENRDLSTILHEAGHFFLESMGEIARAADAPQELKDDYAAMLRWLGSDGTLTVEQHEKFARGTELYFREGRAPSSRLRRMFDTFKRWLTNVYRDVLQLNVKLDPDVRKVFDRMLASEEELDVQENSPLNTPDENFMELLTKAEREAYLKRREKQFSEARAKLLVRMLKQVEREAKAWWKVEREKLRKEFEKQVDAMPVYRAIHFAQTGKLLDRETPEGVERVQLDRKLVAQLYGPEAAIELPRGTTTLKGGVHPDVFADHFGFASGAALVSAMRKAKPREQYIDELTDTEMFNRHGDMLHDGTLAERAREAVENQDRGAQLLYELQVMARKAGSPAATREYYEAQVDTMLADKTLSEAMDSAKYRRAEVRAARQVGKHLARKNYELAAAAKRQQLLNHLLFRRATELRAEVDKALARFKKYARPLRRGKVNIDEDYHAQLVALLDTFNLGPTPNAARVERLSREALAQWMAEKEKNDAAVFVEPPAVLASRKTQLKDMTVEEFRQLADTVDNIAAQGRMLRTVLIEGRRQQLSDIGAEIAASIDSHLKRKPRKLQTRTPWENVKFAVGGYFTMLLKARSLLRVLDGDSFGTAYRYVLRAIDRAELRKNRRLQGAGEAITELLVDAYGKKHRGIISKSVDIHELGIQLNKDGLLAVVLNMGNADNRQKLIDGHGWTEEQLRTIASQLTAQDAAFINSVWEYIDSFWPEVAALEKRTQGVTPAKVEAEPFQLALSDGTVVNMRGGYYPIKYDDRLSTRAPDEASMAMADIMRAGRFASAQTRQGHTKARVQHVELPVRLDLGPLYQHVSQVITDIEMREPIWNAYKVLQQKDVVSAITETMGVQAHSYLDLWVKDVGVGSVMVGGAFDGFVAQMRAGVSISVMGFKLSTTMVQLTGYAHTVARVGPLRTLQALWALGAHPQDINRTVHRVYESSEFMRQRATTFHRDLYDALRAMEGRGEIRSGLAKAGFWPIVKMQQLVDVPTWLAGYREGTERFPGDEQKAVEYADSMVIEAQGSGLMKDLSAIERGTTGATVRLNAVIKLFTVFYSYFNTKLNLAYTKAHGTQYNKPKDVARLAADYLMIFWLEAAVGALLLGQAPDEDDEESWLWWSTKLLMQNTTAMLPGLREIAGGVAGFGASPAGLRGFEAIADAVSTVGREVEDVREEGLDGLDIGAVLRSLNTAAGIVFRYPGASQLNQVIRGFEQAAGGEQTTPIDYLLYQER